MSEAMKRKLEIVESNLSNMYDDDILPIWNEYCVEVSNDDYIYENDEYFFRDYFSDPYQAIQRVYYGTYNITDSYVMFDGYGNVKSLDWVTDVIDYGNLAEWYLEHHEDDCEEWFDELYAELEEEAIDIALYEVRNLYKEDVTHNNIWKICISVADDYECDVDELYDNIMERLN